jgi:hypothetical protein
MKRILKNRLEFAIRAAYQARTIEEFNFLINCIKELKFKLEEV